MTELRKYGKPAKIAYVTKRFLSVHDRGNLTLPADIRRQYGLDKPGVQVEVVARPGVIELRPHVAVPADQAWFWTQNWQEGERTVDKHVAAGRVTVARDVDDFVAAMDKVRKKKRTR
jgi:bifunctional DNA-binding transcriptional regulator/antitoxin component of YhaV-PrlF toxin-antitoxin module